MVSHTLLDDLYLACTIAVIAILASMAAFALIVTLVVETGFAGKSGLARIKARSHTRNIT